MSYYDEPIIIIYTETNLKEDYYEDDYGHEYQTLNGTTKVRLTECKNYKEALYEVGQIGDSNADNPPYDSYNFVIAFCKNSKEVLPKDLRCWAGEEAYQKICLERTKPEEYEREQR
jgi:hypothetical protein